MGIDQDTQGIVIQTTDIHLPRRIGESAKRLPGQPRGAI
jgi:hypothetical protein